MQGKFKVLTLSYKDAPISVREAVALSEIGCRNLLDKVKEFTACTDVLVLSTCNRTEVYYTSDKECTTELVKLIAMEKGFIATKGILPYFKAMNEHEAAITHLFRVSLGLESQVVGDAQIMNQVKNAYRWAIEADTVGPFLHRLLHTVFNANKLAVNSTNFRDGAASVSYATVEMVEELTKAIAEPRVLLIGVGDIGRDVCLNFQKSRIQHLTIVNRTHHRAVELAQRVGAAVAYWEHVWREIEKADVVISSVPGDCFFISEKEVGQLVITERPKLFLDLSMPRSIDVALGTIPQVTVYNIDAVRSRTTKALELRLASVPAVEQIVEDAVAEFRAWASEVSSSPVLQQFKRHLEEIRQQELARYSKKLSPAETELIDTITQRIVNKIVKKPAIGLKAACQRGEPENLAKSLRTLFDLDKQDAQQEEKMLS